MENNWKKKAAKLMQRADENCYAYLMRADDDFEYERLQNKPQIKKKTTLDEIEKGKSYQKKYPTNEETWALWDENKRASVKAKMEKEGYYIECEPGPLREEPGLVGVWQQQSSGGWRQVGIELTLPLLGISEDAANNALRYVGQNYKEYGIREAWRIEAETFRSLRWKAHRPADVSYQKYKAFPFTNLGETHLHRYMSVQDGYGVGTARTCRCFLWHGKPYKSAFYTPEETAYLVDSRATFYELLDCDVIYADDETRALLSIPVVDYMFDKQHQEYPQCVNVHSTAMPSPEELFLAFGERCLEVMSYTSVPEFRPFNKVSSACGKIFDDESRCQFVEPEAVFPHLLDDFLIQFRIAKEYGSKQDEYARWEEKGGLDRVIAIYQRLKKWVDMCGLSGKYYGVVHYGWILSFMTFDNMNYCFKESLDRHYDGDVEDYAHRALYTFMAAREGTLSYTDAFCMKSDDVIAQVIHRPYLAKGSEKELESIIRRYVLPVREKNKPNVKLGLLTEDDRATLQTALKIMHITLDEYWSLTDGTLKTRYRDAIKNVHPDAGGTAEQAAEVNLAYQELVRLKEKYML